MYESYVNGEIGRAYENVGLLASDVWNFDRNERSYQRSNLNLWIQFNEIEQKLIEDEPVEDQSTSTEDVQTVKNSIPFSRLASYGDFAYSEERENLYFNDEMAHFAPNIFLKNRENLEIWMLPEVEEEFRRISNVTSSRCFLSPRLSLGSELVSEKIFINTNPYQWLTNTSWPYQLLYRYPDLTRTLQDSKKESLFTEELMPTNYNMDELKEKLLEYPCPKYSVETNEDLELHNRIDSPKVRNIWNHHFDYDNGFILNAESPEFKPAVLSRSVMNYPSIFDASYQEALFPYSFGMRVTEETNEYWTTQSSCNDKELADNLIAGEGPLIEISTQHNTCIFYPISDDLPITKLSNTENMIKKIYGWIYNVYLTRLGDFIEISSTRYKIHQVFMNIHQAFQLGQKAHLICADDNAYNDLERGAQEQFREPSFGSKEKFGILKSSENINEVTTDTSNQISENDASQIKPNCRLSQSFKKKGRVRLIDLSPAYTSRTQKSVKRNPSSVGSVKSIEGLKNTQSPSKKYTGTKNKRLTKKEKNKRKKNKSITKRVETRLLNQKLLLINKFINAAKCFQNFFLQTREWKFIQHLLPIEVVVAINDGLQIMSQCSQSFVKLTTLKNDGQNCTVGKALQMAENCFNILKQSFSILTKYVSCYIKIAKIQQWQQNFVLSNSSRSSVIHLRDSRILEEDYSSSVHFPYRNMDNDILKLIHHNTLHSFDTLCRKREWKLELNRKHCRENGPSVEMYTHNRYFLGTRKEYLKVEYQRSKVSKSVIILEDNIIWNRTQWEHLEGWVFKEVGDRIDWCYKFNVNSLENLISSVSITIWNNWFVLNSKSTILNKKAHTKVPLWSPKGVNPDVKLYFLKLLVKHKDEWYFKDIILNWQAHGCLVNPHHENVYQINTEIRHFNNLKLENALSEDTKIILSYADVDLKNQKREDANKVLIEEGVDKIIDECVGGEKRYLPCFIL